MEDEGKGKELTDELTVAYQSTVSLYIQEGQLLWQRFNVFIVAHSLLLSVIGFSITADNSTWFIDIIFPMLGTVICLFWYIMTWHSYKERGHWIYQAQEIEKFMNDNARIFAKRSSRHRGESVMYHLDGRTVEKKLEMMEAKQLSVQNVSYYMIYLFVLLYCIRIIGLFFR